MNWFPMPCIPDLSGDETILLVHLLGHTNRSAEPITAKIPTGSVSLAHRQTWLSERLVAERHGWTRKWTRALLRKLEVLGLVSRETGVPKTGPRRVPSCTLITVTGAWVSTDHNLERVPSGVPKTGPKKSRGKAYPPEFEAFWEHYPRRSGKEDAAKAFLEAAGRPGVTAAGLAERSTAFGEALGNGLAPGAPLAGTWLRAGRYDDDPDEWVRMACRTLKLPDPTRPVIGEREARSALAVHQWQTQEVGR